MKNIRRHLFPLLAAAFLVTGTVASASYAQAAPDSVDPGFRVGTGVGPSGAYLESVAIGSDGKIVIGGSFQQFNGVTRNNVAQLNADGSLDTTFDSSVGPDGLIVFSVAVQSNGKVVIGGIFDAVNGTTRGNIAQLNADGSVDTTFDPGTGTNGKVYSVAVQSDGKVVIGGEFTQVNGVTSENIARLNADGSVDTGFTAGTGADAAVYAVAVGHDGKIVVGGEFNQINGATRDNIAQLNPDGSLDTTFDPGTGTDELVNCVAVQADGRVAIGGYFNTVNGVVHNCIAQLNANGSVDATFDPGIGANEPLNSVTVQDNGKVIVTGGFSQIDNVSRYSIARLNADGSVDASFAPVLNAEADCVAVQSDGKIVIGGSFGTVDGVTLPEIARLKGGDLSVITSPTAATASVGMAFSYQITATNHPTSYGVGGLFKGITVNQQTGLVSGTPTAAGTHALTLRAINASGTGTQTLTLAVDPAGSPSVTSAKTATAQVGEAFSYQITASNTPTSYGVAGLRPGLSVDKSTGVITGTPTGAGTFTLTLKATNDDGTGMRDMTLTIKPSVPVITSPNSASATAGKAFTYQIKATSSPTSYGVGGLFKGITVNQQTGLISGTPTAAGMHTLNLRAQNSGGTGTENLTLTVSN